MMLVADTLHRAAGNIAHLLGDPPGRAVRIFAGPTKYTLAEALQDAARQRGLRAELALLSADPLADGHTANDLARRVADGTALVFLVDPPQAPWLFGVLGRPDRGLLLPEERVFCDWFLSLEALRRTYAVNMDEALGFRARLIEMLNGAAEVHITTPRGSDLWLTPRHWILHWGEVFTAPLEGTTRGTMWVDGAAYGGPVTRPWRLRIEDGAVANLHDLDPDDPQQRMALGDLTRDARASIVAELGLGVNLGARWDADIMEAEQARGTCHIGLGHNLAYGGANESASHTDFCLLRPTIRVDDRILCVDGRYRL